MTAGAFAIAALLSTQAPMPGASGWGPISIGMDRAKAEAALREAKIAFEAKTLHKDGKQLLTLTRDDGWTGAIYFNESAKVSQVGFTSPSMTAADAKAFLASCDKSLGVMTRGYDKPDERRGEKVWAGKQASLGISWSYDPSGNWTIFETWHEAGY